MGSPPPMRGKANHSNKRNQLYRITPAYAGKSFLHPRRRHMQKDHPRLCGEKRIEYYTKCTTWGSPPPMRGKGPRPFFEDMETRITPAYAGKSCRSSEACKPVKDHPRLCGEKQCRQRGFRQNTGSPPPMRGKVV